MKYIDSKNETSRIIRLVNNKDDIEAESVLIYEIRKSMSAMLFVVLKELSSNLYVFVIFEQKNNTITPKLESDNKFLNWRSANETGMKIFNDGYKETQRNIKSAL